MLNMHTFTRLVHNGEKACMKIVCLFLIIPSAPSREHYGDFPVLPHPCRDSRFTHIESLANYKGHSRLWDYITTVLVCAQPLIQSIPVTHPISNITDCCLTS